MLPEQLSIILALVCFLLIVIAAISRRGTTTPAALIVSLLLMAAVILAGGLAMRWLRLGQGPFMTLYEVLHSNLTSLTLIFAFIYWRLEKIRVATVITMVFLIVMSAWALTVSAEAVVLPPTFDHPWLWAHVITGKIFLGFCMAATSLAILLLAQHVTGRAGSVATLASHDPLVWRLMAVAFIFHSFMLIAGSVWAHDAWGKYWSWDPLETWSLLTWLSLAVLLHLRVTIQLPLWLGWSLAIAVFSLAFLTFFGLPFISHAPHKGVM